jgi:UDP-glucose 4-epimerase
VRVLVTGGAGFIGSHLVDQLLAEGHEVDVVDNLASGSMKNLEAAGRTGRMTFLEQDIRAPETVSVIAERHPEVVYHLAAQADVRVSVAEPVFDAETNVIGSIHVFEGARQGGARKIVLAGSGGTLYGVPQTIPTTEDHPKHPISQYGVAKKAAGDYLFCYSELYGIEYTVLCLANVYGPRQDPFGEAGVVAIFGSLLLEGKVPTIFGDGNQTRDFVYVEDVASAFASVLEKGGGILANVGTGVETTVNELFEVMASLAGFTGEAEKAPARPGELRRSALDATLLGTTVGWRPSVSLREGLQATIEWIRAASA